MVEQQELVIVTTNFQKFPHLLNYIPNKSLDINVRKELSHKGLTASHLLLHNRFHRLYTRR